jgi:hypothetical protein
MARGLEGAIRPGPPATGAEGPWPKSEGSCLVAIRLGQVWSLHAVDRSYQCHQGLGRLWHDFLT